MVGTIIAIGAAIAVLTGVGAGVGIGIATGHAWMPLPANRKPMGRLTKR